jgi:hypothetical protein
MRLRLTQLVLIFLGQGPNPLAESQTHDKDRNHNSQRNSSECRRDPKHESNRDGEYPTSSLPIKHFNIVVPLES